MTLRRVLVELSVVEQRYQAVLQVLSGASVTEVAGRFGVSRQAVHRWLGRYRDHGLSGLSDRSSRPLSSPAQTPAEVEALICELRRNHPGHRLYALYYLITFRGLRRGESCGLRWPHLNLTDGIATVCWQIVQLGTGTHHNQPKSEAGERQVYLDKHTVEELKNHRTRQDIERLAHGEGRIESGFVFTQENGEPLHPAYVSDQFQQIAMEAGLPPIRLHDLRHGAATILLAAGHDMKVVQETLGLSSITIASDTYTSVLPDLVRQSAEDAATVILNAGKQKNQKSARRNTDSVIVV